MEIGSLEVELKLLPVEPGNLKDPFDLLIHPLVLLFDHPRKEANLLLQTYYLIVGNGICGNRNGGNGGLKLVGHVVDEIRLHLRNFFLFDNLINA